MVPGVWLKVRAFSLLEVLIALSLSTTLAFFLLSMHNSFHAWFAQALNRMDAVFKQETQGEHAVFSTSSPKRLEPY